MALQGRKVTDHSPQAQRRRELDRIRKRHYKGDHSLCEEGKCPAKTRISAKDALEERLTLGVTGKLLWEQMTADNNLGPMQSVLLLQACRIADWLDQLDAQLRGEDWLRFRHSPNDENEIHVYVDKVLSEAREQATALKGLIAELRQMIGKSNSGPATGSQNDVVADLVARIAQRRAEAKA